MGSVIQTADRATGAFMDVVLDGAFSSGNAPSASGVEVRQAAELTRAIALALLRQDVDDLQELSQLLRTASHVVSQALESASREHDDRPLAMTPREKDVLHEMQWHQTVQRIAQVLFVSPNTVKTHMRSIYLKLEVATRDQAIKKAYALGML